MPYGIDLVFKKVLTLRPRTWWLMIFKPKCSKSLEVIHPCESTKLVPPQYGDVCSRLKNLREFHKTCKQFSKFRIECVSTHTGSKGFKEKRYLLYAFIISNFNCFAELMCWETANKTLSKISFLEIKPKSNPLKYLLFYCQNIVQVSQHFFLRCPYFLFSSWEISIDNEALEGSLNIFTRNSFNLLSILWENTWNHTNHYYWYRSTQKYISMNGKMFQTGKFGYIESVLLRYCSTNFFC